MKSRFLLENWWVGWQAHVTHCLQLGQTRGAEIRSLLFPAVRLGPDPEAATVSCSSLILNMPCQGGLVNNAGL